jgi:hypothetical protein
LGDSTVRTGICVCFATLDTRSINLFPAGTFDHTPKATVHLSWTFDGAVANLKMLRATGC